LIASTDGRKTLTDVALDLGRMIHSLATLLCCPTCGKHGVTVFPKEEKTVDYDTGPVNEIREGTIVCGSCRNKFMIKDFVPRMMHGHVSDRSALLDGQYWGRMYKRLFDKHIMNYVDIREQFTPFYRFGVSAKFSWDERLRLKETLPLNHLWLFQNDEHARCLQNLSTLAKGKRVLDIGCGSGWLSLEARRKGFDVVGTDPSIEALTLAKEYSMQKRCRIEYVQADFDNIPFVDTVFDALIAFHSLHHAPNLEKAVQECLRVLKPEGLMQIYEPRNRTRILKLIRFLLSSMMSGVIRMRHENSLPMTSFSRSRNEEISVAQINEIPRYLNVISEERYFHFLNDIPLLLYLASNNRRLLGQSSIKIDRFYACLKRLTPDLCEFVHYISIA